MAGAGDKFELPVSGQRIPHNWFTRLVLFLNSLVPRGDGNILVTHTPDGVTLKINPKLLRQPNGAPPAAGGGAPSVTGMVYPDWTRAAFADFYLNTPYTVTGGDAWIYLHGNWTTTGAGTSYLSLTFSDSGGAGNGYQIASFISTGAGQQRDFTLFLPVKNGITFELTETSTNTHVLTIVNAHVYRYPTT